MVEVVGPDAQICRSGSAIAAQLSDLELTFKKAMNSPMSRYEVGSTVTTVPTAADPSSRARSVTPAIGWRKSSYSQSGECVEVGQRTGMIVLRDSNKARGPVLRYTAEEWESFVRGIKAGEFDDLTAPKSVPLNWLDLIDRIMCRATSSWSKCLMHLILLAAIFGGLGIIAHVATGVSPWVAAAGSLGGGAAAGGTVYARRRANKRADTATRSGTSRGS